MPVSIARYRRYPATDRNELAGAALELCRATRRVDGVRTRFYWINPNEVLFVTEAESPAAMANFSWPTEFDPARAKAGFDLSDLALLVDVVTATEPARGADSHSAAGRVTELPR